MAVASETSMLISLALTSLALADEPAKDAFPKVTVNGVVFAHYGLDLTEGADNMNSFDLDRAYLGADGQITKGIGAKILLDAGHGSVEPSLNVYVKNAWIEGKGFLPGVKARFGVVDTGYATHVDKFTGRRYLFKSFSDENKYQSTADLGVNVQGEHLNGLVGWHVAAINGEGYKSIEVNAGKTLTGRVTVDPLASNEDLDLPISAFVSEALEPEDSGTDSKLTYAAHVGFKFKKFVLFSGEYVGASQGDIGSGGFSVLAIAGAPKYANLVVRFDQNDPNADQEKDGNSSFRIGVDRAFADKVSAAIMYERSWLEVSPETASHGIFVRAQAGF